MTEQNAMLVDELNRVVVGTLTSTAYSTRERAESALAALKALPIVRANVRRGKDNEWFAVLEDHEGVVLVTQMIPDKDLAHQVSLDARNALRN